MTDNDLRDRDMVPYIVHESSMARSERTIKRLVIALVFAIVLMFTCNALWLLAWSSYDYSSTETVTVDGKDGIANYIGNDNNGDIGHGESSGSENKNADAEKSNNTKR